MGKYRVSLGRTQSPDNLVIDGDFPSAASFAANWGTSDPDWIWNAGNFAQSIVGNSYLRQQNVFELGKVYTVYLTKGAGGAAGIFIGDYGNEELNSGAGIVSDSFRCLKGTDLQYYNAGPNTADNVEAYEMIYNTPLNDEPMGLIDGSITVDRDEVFNALFRSFTSVLTFWGDGWDYLYGQYQSQSCEEIDCLIERQCDDGDSWETFFEGIIHLSDIEWDLQKCEALVTVEDASVAQVLQNQRNVALNTNDAGIFANFFPNPTMYVSFHDEVGAYPAFPPYSAARPAYNIGIYFRRLIHAITGVKADFVSSLFDAGTFQNLAFKQVPYTRSDLPAISLTTDWEEINAQSFDDVFTQINNIFNVELFIEYPNGVPTVNLEEKTDLFGAALVITLNNVAGPTFSVFTDNFFKTIEVGYRQTLNSDKSEAQFVSEDVCSFDDLNLVSEWIASSDVIWELLRGEKHEGNIFLNPFFDDGSDWIFAAGLWIIGGGVATKIVGVLAPIGQHISTINDCEDNSFSGFLPGCRHEITVTITNQTQGSLTPFMGGNVGVAIIGNGTFTQTLRADPADDRVGFIGDALFDGDIDVTVGNKYRAKRKWDDEIIVVQTDGVQTTQFGAGFEYNGDIGRDDIMTRWVKYLQNSVVNSRGISTTIPKTNTPLTRVFEFEAPLSKTEFDLILSNPTGKIAFNSPENGIPTDIEGFLKTIVRKNNGGRTEFTLITE